MTPTMRSGRTGTTVALPATRTEDPSSGYTAVFTDARNGAYALVIGSRINLYNQTNELHAVDGDLTLLYMGPNHLYTIGHLFGKHTLNFSEPSGSIATGTVSRHKLDGFVGITKENSLSVATLYGSIDGDKINFIIPTMYRGPFPYREIRESELRRMQGRYDAFRRERSTMSLQNLMVTVEELFKLTTSSSAYYEEFARDKLPESLRKYPSWFDLIR